MKSKKCIKCGIVKPLDEFYKHPQMADGYTNKCKECTKKENRENRIKNLEYYQKYDRDRSNQEKRILARKEYQERMKKEGKWNSIRRKSNQKYRNNNRDKAISRSRINHAICSGKIIKPSRCSICGKKGKIQAHHSDYLKSLQVLWVCDSCHKMIHRELRKEKREQIKNNK